MLTGQSPRGAKKLMKKLTSFHQSSIPTETSVKKKKPTPKETVETEVVETCNHTKSNFLS